MIQRYQGENTPTDVRKNLLKVANLGDVGKEDLQTVGSLLLDVDMRGNLQHTDIVELDESDDEEEYEASDDEDEEDKDQEVEDENIEIEQVEI